MFKFGASSLERLQTCHADLQIIASEALQYSDIDFSIVEGYRPIEVQQEYYSRGRENVEGVWVITDKSKVITGIDGVTKKGKHNHKPSQAFDIRCYFKGKPELAYKVEYLAVVQGTILSTAKRLLVEGKVTHEVRCGADWDRDGEMYDHKFIDRPHFELI